MTSALRVNDQEVQIRVMNPDGQVIPETLTEDELLLVSRADRLLRISQEFLRVTPGARLTLIECHQGRPVGSRGRLYLQYAARHVSSADVWVYEGPEEQVDLRRGVVILPGGS